MTKKELNIKIEIMNEPSQLVTDEINKFIYNIIYNKAKNTPK